MEAKISAAESRLETGQNEKLDQAQAEKATKGLPALESLFPAIGFLAFRGRAAYITFSSRGQGNNNHAIRATLAGFANLRPFIPVRFQRATADGQTF